MAEQDVQLVSSDVAYIPEVSQVRQWRTLPSPTQLDIVNTVCL